MCPIEIVAYKGGEEDKPFGDFEVLEGTKEELVQLKKILLETWQTMGGITVVYDGDDLNAAKESIKGLPRVSEEL